MPKRKARKMPTLDSVNGLVILAKDYLLVTLIMILV